MSQPPTNSRQSSVLKSLANKGSRPRGIDRKQTIKPVRKSERLQQLQRKTSKRNDPLPSPSVSNSFGAELRQDLPASEKPLNSDRKRKRSQGPGDSVPRIGDGPFPKRPRAVKDTLNPKTKSHISNHTDPIKHWIQKGTWPKKYSEQDRQFRNGFKQDTWLEKYSKQEGNMSHLLARKKSSVSLCRKRSISSSDAAETTIPCTPSDQKPREEKSTPYNDVRYEILLQSKGSYMKKSDLGITDKSKDLCIKLFSTEQTVPKDSLFNDNQFDKTCEKIRNENEARVVRDISLLIVPSAEILETQSVVETQSAPELKHLKDSVNQGWNNSVPVTKTRPQPDYSVGFSRSAFTEDQLEKLRPFVGDLYDTSHFMATWQIYFPFLTCEVKCGAAALDVADRQNAHSMFIAVRAVVELYKLVGREKELNREILAFSISHDHSMVRIYGHYALIQDDKTTFYRHPVDAFDFTTRDGREKWTAYKFTKNVYNLWMPIHLKRICSAIDDIPSGINFELSLSASVIEGSELPDYQLSNAEPVSELKEDESLDSQKSRDTATFKKPRLPSKSMIQQENDRQKERIDELKRENDRQKQENDRQKQESDRQRQEIDELKEQTKELMNMLKHKFT
ncbi:hypothetical protein MMC31_003951 [Peltigera leucophlebia]|nr:hypothetical protein [Peltigera leucophlebia]